jgi:hypothetical protein
MKFTYIQSTLLFLLPLIISTLATPTRNQQDIHDFLIANYNVTADSQVLMFSIDLKGVVRLKIRGPEMLWTYELELTKDTYNIIRSNSKKMPPISNFV